MAMLPPAQEKMIAFLSGFATPNRLQRFEQVLSNRTRYISIALENIFQGHNASAVLRSMECIGIQDIHIIENGYEYDINPEISLGANKWLTLKRYNRYGNNTNNAVDCLRGNGYRIVATTPSPVAQCVDEFDLEKGPAVFFFGTELDGLSEEMISQADEQVRIPICGFTESFNVSVCAALMMYLLTEKLKTVTVVDWGLTDKEKQNLRLEWLKRSVRHSDLLIQRFLSDKAAIA